MVFNFYCINNFQYCSHFLSLREVKHGFIEFKQVWLYTILQLIPSQFQFTRKGRTLFLTINILGWHRRPLHLERGVLRQLHLPEPVGRRLWFRIQTCACGQNLPRGWLDRKHYRRYDGPKIKLSLYLQVEATMYYWFWKI